MSTGTPVWNLESVYSDLGSEAYERDVASLERGGGELVAAAIRIAGGTDLVAVVAEFVDRWNEFFDLSIELGSYAYCRFSVATGEAKASKELNRIEELTLPLKNGLTIFRKLFAERVSHLDAAEREAILASPRLTETRYFLEEQLELAHHQMSPELEELAADLARSGADAWSRLQESVASTLKRVWNEATGEEKTVVELRSMAFDPDRGVRRKAFELELEAWKSVEIPLAYSLNGVKGSAVSLTRRRGFDDSRALALLLSRITPATLEALIGAMRSSLPGFRRYLAKKARLLGVDRLAFYDLFAPVGSGSRAWAFEEAREFVVARFTEFSSRIGGFANRAFEEGWIDAKSRSGKIGGAYCTSFPRAKESRILCNFDGSLSSVLTIAHELGHAYHHEVLKDAVSVHRDYPMTLAETASIFCELIVLNAALASSTEAERVVIAEQFLQDSTQVIVDILSRYEFERSLFEGRAKSELSPEELCTLMRNAQLATYGDGLDPDALHPYMWAVKGHYYRQDLPFYNFPYAFGLLFGSAIYRRYRETGASFVPIYDALLAGTGRAGANAVAAEAGFDIESEAFWSEGIAGALTFVDALP